MKSLRPFCSVALACGSALGLIACASSRESQPAPTPEEPQAETTEASTTRTADIQTLEFSIEIAAPVAKVWDTMLSPDGYTQWTSPFMAGSYFEGTWKQGERMRFLAPGGNGMVAVIAENRLHEVVSIQHLGFLMNGIEDTTSEGIKSWAPAYEIYRFEKTPTGTRVSIEHEVLKSFEGYMNDVWPKALAELKSVCEGQ